MWRSKMAARWRGEDGNLNAGNRDFVVSNIPSELVLSGHDVGGVEMDHSILSIFEDRSVTSEDKTGTEEVSETLLSALTEMLDSVEDDDGTPFDTLPDTKLLTQSEHKDHSVEFSHIDTLKPKSKSPSVSVTIRIDAEKGGESKTETDFKQQSQTLFRPNDKKTEADVEVFTSSSLANLVKIMHSYCLKLHVEEEADKLRRNHALFSQEEVWRYERPSEENDEEINVVSDDELAVKEAKGEEEGGEDSTNGKLLKGVLLNGNLCRAPSSREKKRVSFGPVHVALFGESVEKGVNEKSLTSGNTSQVVSLPQNNTKAYRSPDGSAAVPQTPPSQVSSNMVEALPPKGETKAKSLSLQQYRQLRQKRQILMEKQQNYTTMWPSVSEPPQELTPILCSKGQRQDSCGPKTAQHYPGVGRCGADQLHRSQMSIYKTRLTSAHLRPHPPEARSSAHVYDNKSKPSRTESKSLPPASPLPDVSANTKVIVPESKRSPVKKPTLLNSDPPNPVILPLPVSHTTSASTNHSSSESEGDFPTSDSNLSSTRHLEDIQKESSGTSLQQQSLSPEPVDMLTNQECTSLFQKDKNKFTERASEISCSSQALTPVKTQEEVSSWCHELQPQTWNLNLTKQTGLEPKTKDFSPHFTQSAPVSVPIPVQETDCRVRSASSDSGIEAPDLTSLLEQFEETQAKEESLEPRLVSAAPNVQTDSGRTQSVETKQHSTSPLTPSAGPFNPLSTSESPTTPKALENPRMSEDMDIPESLGTEVILSTQQDLPARRKNPSSKTIQIIEPRPLPSKKTHNSVSEFSGVHSSPNTYSSVSSDHDYCVPVDHSPKSAALHSRASKHNGVSENADELRVTTHDSTAAAENKKQTSSSREVNATIKAVNKSVMQHLCKQTRTETNPSTDKVMSLLDCGATQQTCGLAADVQTAQCTLPTPPPSPPARGREKRRYRRRSPRSDSSSSSCSSSSSSSASRSPKRQKHHHKRSESSSCSSSPSRSISRSPPRRCTWSCCRSRSSRSRSRSWSQSRSRSRSWSQSRSRSRSRSPSLWIPGRKWTDVYNSRESRRLRRDHEMRIQKLKAIDERRVVYVGRICRSMTHSELRERFSQFGEVECVSLHFRDQGDHYGFVTFYNMEDAFAAIDNGSKLRRPDELPFDICFGGRRQFCNSDYADLDANRETDPSPAKSRFEDVDFDSLLKQAQRGLKR